MIRLQLKKKNAPPFLKSSLRHPSKTRRVETPPSPTPFFQNSPPGTNSAFSEPASTKATVTTHADASVCKAECVAIAKAPPRQLAALHMQKGNEDCVFHLQLQRCARRLNGNGHTQQFFLSFCGIRAKGLRRLRGEAALWSPTSGALGCLNPPGIAPSQPGGRRCTLG